MFSEKCKLCIFLNTKKNYTFKNARFYKSFKPLVEIFSATMQSFRK